MRIRVLRYWLAAVIALHFGQTAFADVRLPQFMNSHMVLQRDLPIPLWGWADPGESVTATLGTDTATAKANEKGEWRLTFPARSASRDPLKLTVSGKNKLAFDDILIGDVWLCSGQSNMEWTVDRSANAAEEIAAGNHPLIRHVKIPRITSGVPRNDVEGKWEVCSPETVAQFTAVGYYMARKLQKELDIPIGLINSSWGGTRIEPWVPPVGFAGVPELKDISDEVTRRNPEHPAYKKAYQAYLKASEDWLKTAKANAEAGKAATAAPAFPAELKLYSAVGEPTALYNAMIHPLVGWPIRGAIWYQGESNSSEGMLYRAKMQALIEGWRKIWGQGEFPFYFVQIAPYNYGHADHVLAEFWEAQAASAELPQTGMAVISDIATLGDIHPPNKQDVGLRLALLALKNTYGKADVVATGATFKSLAQQGNKLVVTFENTAGGLQSRDGKPLTWFEIIGPGAGWAKAEATINGDTVVLTAPGVATPTAVRFAWHKQAEPNLMNGAKLPTSAFRAGDVPQVNFLPQIEEAKNYKLALDIDLQKLGPTITYDVDHRGQLGGGFDRVAYLLELQAGSGPAQYVYVSMNAFTKDVNKIGIPTADSKAVFQQLVEKMTVVSNVAGIENVVDSDGGNIEFWPHNYGAPNGANIPGASGSIYDFGDTYSAPVDGYGSMQVHNFKAKQTLFAINAWKSGPGANIGIGNSPGEHRDWTFTPNANSYSLKRLRVLVRPIQ